MTTPPIRTILVKDPRMFRSFLEHRLSSLTDPLAINPARETNAQTRHDEI